MVVRKRSLALLGLLAFVSTTASALTVTETTDYPGGVSSFDPNIGSLDSGANTLSGSLNGICATDCNPGNQSVYGDTADTFQITVPVGYQITGITVTTSSVSGPSGFSASFALQQSTSGFANVIFTPFLSPLNGTTANLVTTPVVAGTYFVSVYGQQSSAPGPFSLNWSISINLAPTVVSSAGAITNLISLITNPYSGLVLTQGQVSSFTDKLNNALASVQAGQNKQAINQLNAFIQSVDTALKTGRISAADANTLTVAAGAIITSLQ